MPSGSITMSHFWTHPYVQDLAWRGRLALAYAVMFNDEKRPIIIEDMARATGLDISEVTSWVEIFIEQGKLPAEAVAIGQL